MTIDQLTAADGDVLGYDAQLKRWCVVYRDESGTIWGQFDEPVRSPEEQAAFIYWQRLAPTPDIAEERLTKLEDAERIAWVCTSATAEFDFDYVNGDEPNRSFHYFNVNTGFGTWMGYKCGPVFDDKGCYLLPRLTPEIRAIIDKARATKDA